MGCMGECSGCFEAGSCQYFYENFVLPDVIKEQQKEEYLKQLSANS